MQAEFSEAFKKDDLAGMTRALDAGADINAADAYGRTALHEAAKGKSEDVIRLLLDRGADVNRQDADGRTPLHLAHYAAMDLLLARKADWNIVDKQGNSPLHTAAELETNRSAVRLIDAGVKVDVKNSAGLTPLHFATMQGSRETAALLISRGAKINAKTTADYAYKWMYIDPSVQGMEQTVPAKSTPMSIAREQHRQTKWSNGRKFSDLADFYKLQGGIEPPGKWSRREWILTAPLSIATLVLLVWGICHVDARMRKWSAMAEKFATTKPPAGKVERYQDGVVGNAGLITLKNMLTASVSDEGLYVAMPRLLQTAHPPLLVPWNQVRVVDITSSDLVQGPIVTFSLGRPKVGSVILRGGLAKDAMDRAR